MYHKDYVLSSRNLEDYYKSFGGSIVVFFLFYEIANSLFCQYFISYQSQFRLFWEGLSQLPGREGFIMESNGEFTPLMYITEHSKISNRSAGGGEGACWCTGEFAPPPPRPHLNLSPFSTTDTLARSEISLCRLLKFYKVFLLACSHNKRSITIFLRLPGKRSLSYSRETSKCFPLAKCYA